MNKTDFLDIKLIRPVIPPSSYEYEGVSETFDLLEGYIDQLESYIYTDINYQYDPSDERLIPARIQEILSSTLLRSIYLRNGLIEAINTQNILSVFAILKSFMEIPALLAHLYSLMERDLKPDDYLKCLQQISLGNKISKKDSGKLRIGHIDSVNILTMFETLDRYIAENETESLESRTPMTDLYGVICNASHPNYDAHSAVRRLGTGDMKWSGLSLAEFKNQIAIDVFWYKPALKLSLITIPFFAKMITDHCSIDGFKLLKSPRFFS